MYIYCYLTESKRKGLVSGNRGVYDLFFSGVHEDQCAQQGVAIMVRKSLRRIVVNWEAISQRISKMNLNSYGHKITVLGVYGMTYDAISHPIVAVRDVFFEDVNEGRGNHKSGSWPRTRNCYV